MQDPSLNLKVGSLDLLSQGAEGLAQLQWGPQAVPGWGPAGMEGRPGLAVFHLFLGFWQQLLVDVSVPAARGSVLRHPRPSLFPPQSKQFHICFLPATAVL